MGQLACYGTQGLQTNAEINCYVRQMSHGSYCLEYFIATSILYNKYFDLFYIVQHKKYYDSKGLITIYYYELLQETKDRPNFKNLQCLICLLQQ